MCRFKTSPCMPAQRAHVLKHVRVVPVQLGHFERTHGDVFEWTHGGVFIVNKCFSTFLEHLKRMWGSSLIANFLLTKICPHRVITCFRGSPKSNHWILPTLSLRTGRTRNVPNSSNHSLYLIKVLSSNPEGKRWTLPTFCSIIERSVAIYSSYEARKNTLQTI